VVDPEHLRLVENRVQLAVQDTRRFQVGTERFLGDHPGRPLSQAGVAEHAHDGGKSGGRDGQVEQPPRRTSDFLLGPLDRRLQFGRVTWFCHPKRKPVLEAWPGRIVRLGDAKSRHRVPGVRAEFLVGQRERLWCRADDPVLVRQQARHMQMEQPG
jgi:hypothetical protein